MIFMIEPVRGVIFPSQVGDAHWNCLQEFAHSLKRYLSES